MNFSVHDFNDPFRSSDPNPVISMRGSRRRTQKIDVRTGDYTVFQAEQTFSRNFHSSVSEVVSTVMICRYGLERTAGKPENPVNGMTADPWDRSAVEFAFFIEIGTGSQTVGFLRMDHFDFSDSALPNQSMGSPERSVIPEPDHGYNHRSGFRTDPFDFRQLVPSQTDRLFAEHMDAAFRRFQTFYAMKMIRVVRRNDIRPDFIQHRHPVRIKFRTGGYAVGSEIFQNISAVAAVFPGCNSRQFKIRQIFQSRNNIAGMSAPACNAEFHVVFSVLRRISPSAMQA